MNYFITKYDIDPPEGAMRCVLDDTIMHKGLLVTAGSGIIEGFIAPLDATVVTKLEAAEIVILGKTKMDEFSAAGLFSNLNAETRTSIDINESNPKCGTEPQCGSNITSGAVAAVADGIAGFALCNDYTGEVSRQAALSGLCYIRPTYGTVSRYGLIPTVPSMDQIGVVCENLSEGFRALEIISGYDPNDGSMINERCEGRAEAKADGAGNSGDVKSRTASSRGAGLRIGLPVNLFKHTQDRAAAQSIIRDYKGKEFELKYSGVYTQVMQILCSAELSNNISRYDGIKFGYRADGYSDLRELYTKTRTEALGFYPKLSALLGAIALSQENYVRYYDKAMRIRRLINESLRFSEYDAIVLPTGDSATSLPILCGLPAVTLPSDNEGITLVAGLQREDTLKQIVEG